MRNIKLIIEYDGSRFHGWQIQKAERTVQGEICTALRNLLEESPKICVAGRTDAGVHAKGQVANFKTRAGMPLFNIYRGLNFYLPQDVRILDVAEVEKDFHARFSALNRTYSYSITTKPCAIGRQYTWRCFFKLDTSAMQKAADALLGGHVFKAFSKHVPDEQHYLCNVELAQWQENQEQLTFTIRANRFLHNMIRIIVGTLIEVGSGKRKPGNVSEILESQDRDRAGNTAPAHGLCLVQIAYP
jgi:tRNA pseudouridine38-40 synthase